MLLVVLQWYPNVEVPLSGMPAHFVAKHVFLICMKQSYRRALTVNAQHSPRAIKVARVELHQLPLLADMRGSLSVAEFNQHFPFTPKRYFVIFDVSRAEVRGEHAHEQLGGFLV